MTGGTNTPRLSPDGTKATVVRLQGSAILDLQAEYPIEEAELLPPINDELHILHTEWSPDGRRVAGAGARKGERGGRGIWIYDFDTGEYTEFFDRSIPFDWFTETKIAVWIPGEGIVAIDLETGERETIVKDGPLNFLFAADRTWLLTARSDTEGDVWMLDVE